MKFRCILVLLVFIALRSAAQEADTTKISNLNDSAKTRPDKKKLYSRPRTATIMSMCLPGLGQVYNRKIWKVPVIYAGLGGFGYMFYAYNSQYTDISKNLRYEYDDNAETVNTSGYTGEQLQDLKVIPHKRRDLAIIGLGIVYVLNIIDANVDAHLKTFDVSDDLSLQLDPWQTIGVQGSGKRIFTGFSIKLNFK